MAATLPAAARAELNLTLSQQGSNVVLSGSGTLNLGGLNAVTLPNTVIVPASGVTPALGNFVSGSTGSVKAYTGYTGPTNFGSGVGAFANSSSGSKTSILHVPTVNNYLLVPSTYISGGSLSTSATFNNTTIAALGATPGTYRWFWTVPNNSSSSPSKDDFGPSCVTVTDGVTLTVQAVPEPGTVGLGLSAAGTALAGWRTRRRWVG